jgi:hypothetical protein
VLAAGSAVSGLPHDPEVSQSLIVGLNFREDLLLTKSAGGSFSLAQSDTINSATPGGFSY